MSVQLSIIGVSILGALAFFAAGFLLAKDRTQPQIDALKADLRKAQRPEGNDETLTERIQELTMALERERERTRHLQAQVARAGGPASGPAQTKLAE